MSNTTKTGLLLIGFAWLCLIIIDQVAMRDCGKQNSIEYCAILLHD